MEKTMTVDEILAQGCHYDHTASRKGYTRVAERGFGKPYSGRFGIGCVVPVGPLQKSNGKPSSQYEYIEYCVK